MPTVKVSVKWGKENFEGVEIDLAESPLVFKSQIFALTSVPPDRCMGALYQNRSERSDSLYAPCTCRQKVMIKGSLLKDEEWGKNPPKDGATVMVMGSAEAVPAALVEAPKDAPKFVEDLPEDQQVGRTVNCFRATWTKGATGMHND